jgi:hypothetical protein
MTTYGYTENIVSHRISRFVPWEYTETPLVAGKDVDLDILGECFVRRKRKIVIN